MSGAGPEQLWEAGWEGHARAQRRRLAALTLAEKLRWLEDAQALVEHLQRSARVPASDTPTTRDPRTPYGR